MAGSLPLGDVLAAQVICDAAVPHGGLPLNLIVSLLATPPKRHTLGPGTRAAVYFPGLGTFDMTFREGGAIAFELNGRHHIIEPDPGDEEHTSYSDFRHWLILSHLAGQPFVVGTGAAQGGESIPRYYWKLGRARSCCVDRAEIRMSCRF